VVGILSPNASAQKAAPEAYSAEALVLQRVDVVYAMNADGTGYMQKTVVAKIQSEAGLQQLGILSMAFAANSQHVEFHYVRSRRPDGTVTETPLSGVMEQPLQATVQAPFYSDLKVAQIPVKNLQVGDTLEWEGRVVMTKAEAPNEFWGSQDVVTEGAVALEQCVELRAPATKNVTVWTNPALGIKVKESTDGGLKVYRWETKQLKPTVGPEAEAAKEAKKKHIETAEEELDEERGKLPSVAWTTFPNWAAVGDWYRGLELSRATPDDEIKAKVAELTAGKTTDEDKVRAIYEYVSTQVRYIGVAFGVGRYQPHQAVEVLHNQYGDCKDKATLLSAMLAAAGVPSDAALIGAGIRFNDAVPSPAAFNHLITHLKLNGQDVWLDSTEEVAPYRMMYAVLRDREALVVPPTGSPTIEKTPKDPPFASVQTWTAKGTLDASGISDSQITLTERGDDELAVRAAVRTLGPAQYDDMAQAMVGALGYAGKSSHAEFSRPDDVDEPFRMSFAYHREKGGDWDNLRIIPQLAPVSLPAVDESPVKPIRLGTPRTETSTAEMKLPKEWTAELPKAVHEKSPYATYDLTYRFESGTLYSDRKIVILQDKVPVKDWDTYKKFAEAADVGKENYVQLQRAGEADFAALLNGGRPSTTLTVTYTSNPQAEALVKQGSDALNNREDANAETLLEKAKQLNPQQKMLWFDLGRIAMDRGQKWEALQDMQAELTNHPDEDEAYRQAVSLALAGRDKKSAEQTLERWSKQYPTNPLPLIQLSALQLGDNQAASAEENADRAMGMLTDYGRTRYPDLQLTLGIAEMRTGKQDKGIENLTALLKKTDNPAFINDAAYELADANKELALDEQKQRVAIEEMTNATKNWTLDSQVEMTRARTFQLIAAWDTMGWILFREGRVREAKPYIRAAWVNRPDETTRKHLDAVNAKLGGDIASTTLESEEVRGYSLGAPGNRKGMAQYRLLIGHGQVLEVKPAGEKTIEGADQLLRRAKVRELIPEGSDAKLVRTGMLNCYAAECQLVLLP
jgi:tetratricopeptide (TPR) repeat protein